VAVGVTDAEQAPEANVHPPLGENVTDPVGVITLPVVGSMTVAVQFVGSSTTTLVGVQLMLMLLGWTFTVTLVDPLLEVCVESPLYTADTASVPAVAGVMLAEQEAVAPVPVRVHEAGGVNVTVPVGVLALVATVSVTVAVHEVACPMSTVEGVHVTDVDVL
jgi:hypothetical protein